jgi:hypothetical protein
MEHGTLLRSLRLNYARSFQSVSKLYSDSLWQLDAVTGGLIRAWRRLRKAESVWKEHEASLRAEADERVRDVERSFEAEYKETAKVRRSPPSTASAAAACPQPPSSIVLASANLLLLRSPP